MDSELDKSLTHDALLALAGERYFERGEGYHRGGHVYSLVEYDGVIVAKVAGTDEYRVRLWAEDGLAYTCDCPLGVDGAFCKHCVAAGLACARSPFTATAGQRVSIELPNIGLQPTAAGRSCATAAEAASSG